MSITNRQKFGKVRHQLEGLHEEIGVLSKKKPDDAVNIFKLKFINQVLVEANSILDEEYVPLEEFSTFDQDALPTNSDVVMILSQYLKCFERQWKDQRTILDELYLLIGSEKMTPDEVSDFEHLQAQIQSLYAEFGALSKKKSDDAVNKFKLRLVNQVLERANSTLGESNRPFADFLRFDLDEVPTNSDVLLVLSQYFNCLEKIRADNIRNVLGKWYWVINGEHSDVPTAPPRKLKY